MTGRVVMRVHRVRAELVVAACDEELIGRTLPVGNGGHTVTISSHFYGERAVSDEELVWALHRATIVNLLGERVMAVARREGLIGPEGAGSLGGVPHAEIISVPE
ncbi:MAG: DUF424 family protein [Thermoplasmata archaeon]|nr:DUF424 family protein [Thermoplasmata archaeon]